ncbi:RsiW-degrading membrane proteinase PrsW (M82 family) [Isoptericola jiangsuensis]|uniref:RsiW-degrading membrane proteinase PrsW (M82 family) n=1 Tax=Isoptericola jiangsuensis TaxID=548579 RepID=A0A2A9F0E8_9MICO|nr:PrsW family intramembrane metalloprotease [Isoptericola jiangsuensis]PFG44628.1 RsiW-degrading membrane proteinase PrsW (M82 family) [Isoptericola jiangsuensis]
MPPLDPRAVLAGRPTARPSVGVVVTVALSSVCLAVALVLLLHDGASGVAASVVLALAPLPLLLAGVLALDRLEPEPPDALVTAFAWGAGVSVLLALLVNTAGLELWTPLLGVEGGTYATVSLVAPVVEELVKGAVLVGLLWFRRSELNGPTDGIIYGSMVGLGFATVENISYYAFAEPGTLVWTFVVRGVVSPLLHPLCTSLIGVGVASAALRATGRVRPVVAGFAGAIGLHGLWNASTGFGLGGLAVAYAAGAAVLVVLGVVLHRDRLRIVGLVRTYLPLYEPTGVVTPHDVQMLSTLRARRFARERVRQRLGRGPARALADYQQAATELAMLHRRHALGLVDLPAFTARRDPLLTLMAHARAVFAR